MFYPVFHHVVDDEDIVVVFVDDGRRGDGMFDAVPEPPANTCVVQVDGAVVLMAECSVADVVQSFYLLTREQPVVLAFLILFKNRLCRIVQRYAHRFRSSVFGLVGNVHDTAWLRKFDLVIAECVTSSFGFWCGKSLIVSRLYGWRFLFANSPTDKTCIMKKDTPYGMT